MDETPNIFWIKQPKAGTEGSKSVYTRGPWAFTFKTFKFTHVKIETIL